MKQHWTQKTQKCYLIEHILFYKTLFFNAIITISCTFSLVMNKSLHVLLINIYTSRDAPLLLSPLLKYTMHHLTVLTPHVVSRNVQQASVNGRCFFFRVEEFNYTRLLHTHCCVRCHFVRLSLCCHLSCSNIMRWNIGGRILPLLPYHQYPSLFSGANIIK